MDFISLLQDFMFPVVACIALASYANSVTNKLVALTEKVTNAMVENANANNKLADTIKEFMLRKEG